MALPHTSNRSWPGWLVAVILAMVLVDAAAYWIVDAVVNPQASGWERAFFRPGGDIEYFPFIRALASGNLFQPATQAIPSNGDWILPPLHFIPYSLLMKLLGPWGFLVADILFQGLRFWLLYRLFLLLRLERDVSLALGALVSLGVFLVLENGLRGIWHGPLAFDRITRPQVTDPLFLGMIWGLLAALNRPRGSLHLGALLLASTLAGMGAHGDFHGLFYGGPLFAGTLAWLAWRERGQWRSAWPKLAVAAIPLAALLVLLLARTAHLAPEASQRLGLFPLPLSRFPRPDEFYYDSVNQFWLYCVGLLGVGAALSWRTLRLEVNRVQYLAVVCAGVSMLLIYVAPWLCIASTGKMIQTYQFGQRVGFAGSLVTALGLAALLSAWRNREPLPKLTGSAWKHLPWLLTGLAAVPLALTVADGARAAHSRTHPRKEISPYNRLRHYREDFREVEHFLRGPRGARYQRLATVDLAVYTWWLTALERQVYLVDPFAYSLPDQEVEDRLINFAILCGVRDDSFLNSYATLQFFHSTAKYQFDPAYTFAPLEAYSPEVQARLPNIHFSTVWSLQPPPTEFARMAARLSRMAERSWTLEEIPFDLIILNRPHTEFQPDPRYFEPLLTNRSLRVYGLRKPQ